MKLISIIAVIAGAVEPDVQGRLQIRWPQNRFSQKFGKLTICAKNFEHYPRSEPCDNAPNYELEIEPEIGMVAKGVISTSVAGSRQVDFPFRFKWPGDLSLITWTPEMHHYSGALSSHDGWQMLNLDGVEIEARVFCEKNYYGKSCENYCIPNYSDHSGHYKCNAKTGEKVCHDGWKTTMNAIKCTTPICLAGCEHGRCRRPNECVCRRGYMGSQCNQCQVKPGCRYGTCNRPNECNCQPGYAGRNCDVDLMPCQRSKEGICQNDGLCINPANEDAYYTCKCPPGFTGRHCETRISRDCQCQNGGECGTDGGCLCPVGFSGFECEISSNVDDSGSLMLGVGVGIASVFVVILLAFCVKFTFQKTRGKHIPADDLDARDSRFEDVEEQQSFQSKNNTTLTSCSSSQPSFKTSTSVTSDANCCDTTVISSGGSNTGAENILAAENVEFIQRTQSTEMPPSYNEATNTTVVKHLPQNLKNEKMSLP